MKSIDPAYITGGKQRTRPWHFWTRLEFCILESPFLRVYTTAALNNFHLLHFSSLNVNILVRDLLWPLSILVESEKILNTSKTQAHVQKVHQE